LSGQDIPTGDAASSFSRIVESITGIPSQADDFDETVKITASSIY